MRAATRSPVVLAILALYAVAFGWVTAPAVITQTVAMVVPGGPTLPATCVVRNAFFKTGASAGLYTCNATDTWTGPLGTGGGGGGAPTDAEYWVGAADGTLTNEKNLGALATALVLNTAGTPSAYTGIDCTNQFVRDVSGAGAGTCQSVALATDISGFGTGVATALGIAVGSAGGPVVLNGAGGTPSTITLTNGTGLPLTTGVTEDLPLTNLTQASAASRLLGRGSAGGAGDYQEITIGSGLSMSGTTLSATAGGQAYKFSLTVDGAGTELTTGLKGCATVPLAGTIISATILSTDASFTSGSIAFDVWGNTLDTYPLAVGDSIVASDPPSMTTSTFDFDDDVSTWDTAVLNGGTAATTTVLCAVVDSAEDVTRAQLDLIIQP